jgi:hypothetical protein
LVAGFPHFSRRRSNAKLVASWPRTRPVEIWNSFAGVAPFEVERADDFG